MNPSQDAAEKSTVRGTSWSISCSKCPLAGANGRPQRPVPGEGSPTPKWIALGEGPGAIEIMEGRPFVGPSGRMFARVMEAVNTERDDIWISNVTLCQPRGKSLAELKRARECCWPRLVDELAQFPGVPILAMGAVASQGLLGGRFSINELASSLHDVDVDGTGERPIIATHHPARILRGGDGADAKAKAVDLLFWNLLYDAGKISALGDGRPVRFSDDIEICIDDKRQAEAMMQAIHTEIKACRHCAIDTETTGLNPRKVDLTAIGIATTDRAISIAMQAVTIRVLDILANLCLDPEITKVFHNVPYDEQVLKRYGIDLDGPVEDTLLKHHAAFPGASHKLQDVGCQFFAMNPWKAEFRKGADTTENLLIYNARDALVTARLDPVLDECIEKTDGRRAYEMDNALVPIAIRMEEVGIPIDLGRNTQLHDHFTKIIKRTRDQVEGNARDPIIRAKFIDQLALIRAIKARKNDSADFLIRHAQRYDELKNGIRRKKPGNGTWRCDTCDEGDRRERAALDLPDACPYCGGGVSWQHMPQVYLKGKGPVEFSISNPDHVASYLKARGHQLYRLTKGGKPSTRKDILEEMAHIDDVRTILEFREAAKLDSTFVVGLPIERDHVNAQPTFVQTTDKKGSIAIARRGPWGRLHSSWDLHKITGRWGSSPNVQNWPKQNMRGRPNLRTQVVVPPGKKFVGADFAQLEARIIALLSGDEFLWKIFMSGYGDCDAGCKRGEEPVKFCPQHDIHTVFSLEVFTNFFDYGPDERKELRDLTKRGEYGGFYGGSPDTLYTSIVKEFPDVTLADVTKIITIIQKSMPGVARWHNQLVKDAIKGEIRSAILGRRRAFPLGNAELTIIYNFPVQSTAADIVNTGVLALWNALPDSAEIILQGHDAVVVECDEADAPAVAALMTKTLTQTFTVNDVTMDFPANAAIGDSWDQV